MAAAILKRAWLSQQNAMLSTLPYYSRQQDAIIPVSCLVQHMQIAIEMPGLWLAFLRRAWMMQDTWASSSSARCCQGHQCGRRPLKS